MARQTLYFLCSILILSACDNTAVDSSSVSSAGLLATGIKDCYQDLYYMGGASGDSDDGMDPIEVMFGSGTCQYKDKDGSRTMDYQATRDVVYVAEAKTADSDFKVSDSAKYAILADGKNVVFLKGKDGEARRLGVLDNGRKTWSKVKFDAGQYSRLMLVVDGHRAASQADKRAADKDKSIWLVRK